MACNWLALNGDSRSHEDSKNYYFCLVRQLSGVQADQAAGVIVFFLVFVLGPLTMFTPQLARAKRKGLADYGLLANRYVERFEQKWVRGDTTDADELLGSGDIQSLADLGNSYAAVKEMRPVPFDLQDIGRLAAVTAVPLLPLGLTVFSLEELVMRIVKILF